MTLIPYCLVCGHSGQGQETFLAGTKAEVKHASHWADVYGNGIRVAYVLSKPRLT
jgi:hypothetical protein